MAAILNAFSSVNMAAFGLNLHEVDPWASNWQ